MSYKVGDIIVCSNDFYGTKFPLVIGDKYEVINLFILHRSTMDMGAKLALDIRHIKTGDTHFFVPDSLFIPLNVYREFKLRKIIS